MTIFNLYLEEGFHHISHISSFDHILFLVALSIGYQPKLWRKLIVLVTAFTLGHSITLALATLNIVEVPSAFIEFLIPITILATCVSNLFYFKKAQSHSLKYGITVFFGLIHGLAFSNTLKSLMGMGEDLVVALFAFNIGVELGQLLIVSITISISYLIVAILKIKELNWNTGVLVITAMLSVYYAAIRIPDLIAIL